MKTTIKTLAMATLLLFTQACSKDDGDKSEIQEHDQNKMMGIMHTMEDDMMAMEMTMDPDDDFASMMKIHHQGAIEMANAVLTEGDDPQMREMAQKIITAQQAEIVQLNAFLAVHNPHVMSMAFHDQMMAEMEKDNKQADLQIINGDIDHDFATLMIIHHHGAVESSRLQLIYGHDATMKTLANKIIKDQLEEIKKFQDWLLANRK